MKFSIVSIFCLLTSVWANGQTMVHMGQCKQDGESYGLYHEEGAIVQEGLELAVISSQKSRLTGLEKMGGGNLKQNAGIVEMKGGWIPEKIDLANCSFLRPISSPALKDYYMYLQVYWVSATQYPPVDLDKLVETGDAIPIKVHVICRSEHAVTPAPWECKKVVILDQEIPVDPRRRPISL